MNSEMREKHSLQKKFWESTLIITEETVVSLHGNTSYRYQGCLVANAGAEKTNK
jgi:hypothetical protein